MAGLGDEFEAELKLEEGGDSPAPSPSPFPRPQTPEQIEAIGVPVIKGDFAKTQAASLGLTPKGLGDELEDEELGIKAKPLVAADPKTIKAMLERPKGLGDEFELEEKNAGYPISIKAHEPKTGTGFVRTALTALSIDEHLIVKGISKAAGLPEKQALDEYTYGNLLKDFGAPDTLMTDAAGLALSIVGSPSTYLTFGTSAVGKIGAKTVLTKEGKKLVNAIVKERAELEAAQIAAKTGQELSEEAFNKLVQKEQTKAELEVQKRFGEIHKANQELAIGKDIASLPARIKDKGGMALEAPFSGRKLTLATFEGADIKIAGKTVIPGAEVAQILEKSGVTRAVQALKQSELAQGVERSYAETKDLLGKWFIKDYDKNKDLVEAWRATERQSRDIQNRITQMTESWFKGLSKAQREDFAESALQASLQEQKIGVRSLKGDQAVQEKLDRWFGQGKYAGRESMANKLAKWSHLAEDQKLANWFPGIDKRFQDVRLTVKGGSGPAEREFLKSRSGMVDPNNYTRDPVKAISYRSTEIAFAKLQDRFYERVTQAGMGDATTRFKSLAEAKAAGYDVLPKPPSFYKGNPEKLAKEPTWYAKQEFVDQFRDTITQKSFRIPVISYATDLWKSHVTSMFPAFHARNFNGNIVLNAMRIGGHALDPVKQRLATQMVLGKNLEKTKLTTEIGEKLSLKSILDEAKKEGVISGGFMHDLGGELLDSAAQTGLWSMLSKANPLSTQFAPAVWGRKFGEAVESQARLVNYMTWRQKGLSPKMAAKEVTDALFDYGALTDFEQRAKLLIPFYSFTKNNLKNTYKLMTSRPGVIGAQLKFFRDLGPTESEWENLPEYAKKQFVARVGEKFMSGFGMPMEDIVSLADTDMRELVLRTNPIFRYTMEKAAGVDFNSQRKLETIRSAKEFGPMLRMLENPNIPESVKAALRPAQKWLKLEEDNHGKVTGNPDALHIIRSSFTSRWASMVGMLEDEDREGYEAAMRFALGIIKLKDDPELASSIARRKYIEKGQKITDLSKLGKLFPKFIFIKESADPAARKAYQRFEKAMDKKGQDPSYYRDAYEDFEQEALEMEQERTMP